MKHIKGLVVALFGFLGVLSAAPINWDTTEPNLSRVDVGYDMLSGCTHYTVFAGSEAVGMLNHGPIIHASAGLVFVAWFSHDAYESGPGVRVLGSYTTNMCCWSDPVVVFDSIGPMCAPGESAGYGLWPKLEVVNGRLYATASVKEISIDETIGGVISRLAKYIIWDGSPDSTTYWLNSTIPSEFSSEGFVAYDQATNSTRLDDLEDLVQIIADRADSYSAATTDDVGITLCESSYCELSDGSEVGMHRALWDGDDPDQEIYKYWVYAARRNNVTSDWPSAVCTDIPNSPSKTDCGILPNDNMFIIGNLQASEEVNLRDPLAIAVAEDGTNFCHVYTVRCGGTQCRERNAGDYKGAGFQYPNADVCGDTLWVAYSDAKEQICVSRIPLGEDVLPNGDFESGNSTPSDGWGIGGGASGAVYITGGTAGDTVYAGTRAVSISNPVCGAERWYLLNYALPEASAGQFAEFTVHVKTQNMDKADASIEMVFLDAEKVVLSRVATSISSATDWTALTASGEVPEETAYIRPLLVVSATDSGSDAVVTFDACSLVLSVGEGL